MLDQQTLNQLRQLRLGGMVDALQQQREQPNTHDLSFEERFAFLVQREVLHRENRRLARLLRDAKLRLSACVEDIDYRHPRGLDRPKMASLAQLGWLREAQNLCLTGPTGCGKLGLPVPWVIRPVARAIPFAISASLAFSRIYALPTATVPTLACLPSCSARSF